MNLPFRNPEAIPSFSPRLSRRRYLGLEAIKPHNPNAGCIGVSVRGRNNSFRVVVYGSRLPRVARYSQPWAEG